MSRAKLKKAPLKEVIFELFWELSTIPPNVIPTDSQYELALGSFAEKIKAKGFPVRKRTLPEGLKIYPKPEYQFWKGELTWPVIQLGPGMLTVNDTDKNYSWEKNFKANIDLAIVTLIDSYEALPKFNRIKLQYINAVEYAGDAEDFIREKMLTDVVRKNNIAGKTKGLQILQLFEQEDGVVLTINIQTGLNKPNNKPAIIWTLTVEAQRELDSQAISSWLDRAHNLTSNTFVSMLEQSFYASFDN